MRVLEGWANPTSGWERHRGLGAKKRHYFRDGQSLCGKWKFNGQLGGDRLFDTGEDCGACTSKLAREGSR